jgi:peptidyl-prolyl cis-trans isomerase C
MSRSLVAGARRPGARAVDQPVSFPLPDGAWRRENGAVRRLSREPLLHFVLLGAALFALHRAVAPRPDPRSARRIEVTPSVLAGLLQEHARRTGAPPTRDEERALVRRYVDAEVLYREALALGLDRGDVIVRRRLVQKMELLDEEEAPAVPAEAELQAILDGAGDRWARPARVALEHVFVARDRHADAAAEAARLRARLLAGDDPARLGDPFLRGRAFPPTAERDLAAMFGAPFARAVMALPEPPQRDRGAWSEPIASSFGWHLVRVTAREEARPARLDEVRREVEHAWRERRRAEAKRAALDRLRMHYDVVLPPGGPR